MVASMAVVVGWLYESDDNIPSIYNEPQYSWRINPSTPRFARPSRKRWRSYCSSATANHPLSGATRQCTCCYAHKKNWRPGRETPYASRLTTSMGQQQKRTQSRCASWGNSRNLNTQRHPKMGERERASESDAEAMSVNKAKSRLFTGCQCPWVVACRQTPRQQLQLVVCPLVICRTQRCVFQSRLPRG